MATAMAYYARALNANASDEEAQVAWGLGYQQLARAHRQEIERLQKNGLPLQALGRMVRLEELSIYAKGRQAAAEEPAHLAEERVALTEGARRQIEELTDARSERGMWVFSDVELCRQGAALVPEDKGAMDQCETMAERFRFHIAVEGDRRGAPPAEVLREIVAELSSRNTDRLKLAKPGKRNAVLEVYTSTPVLDEVPWFVVDRSTHRKWVPQTDKKGRQLTKIVIIPPTAQAIAAAQKAKKKPPQPTKKVIKLWKEVTAESRRYRMTRSLSLAWSIQLRDERSGQESLVKGTSGLVTLGSSSSYGECLGDRRACPGLTPKSRAKPVASPERMASEAMGQIAPKMTTWLYKAID